MSATRRKKSGGDPTVREEDNHYPTEPWVTRALIERAGFSFAGKTVLECAAGDGAMVNVLANAGAVVDAVELNAGRAELVRTAGVARHVHRGDFLSPSTAAWLRRTGARYDVVASNPPYGEWVLDGAKPDGTPKWRYRDLALEFAQRALEVAPTVAFLLRVGWMGGPKRHDFHVRHPADLIVLSNRPIFRSSGSDATEYAWFVWRRGATIGTWQVYAATAEVRGKKKRAKSLAPVSEVTP